MRRVPTSRTHIYKCLFDEILTGELFECGFKIDASFESKGSDRIARVKFTTERDIRLTINTNCASEHIFEGAEMSRELGVIYRAYHIANYIRLLERVRVRIPRSYFDSLVTVEAICDELERMGTLYSPIGDGRIKNFRPLDEYCAIRALTEILLRHGELIEGKQREACEAKINELIAYTALPEICFENSREPSYTLISDLERLYKITGLREEALSRYKLFTSCGAEKIAQMSLQQISDLGEDGTYDFWQQAVVRLCAISNRYGIKQNGALINAAAKYRADAVMFMKDCAGSKSEILRSNLAAVKKLSKRTDELFPDIESSFGALHYYE